MDRLIELSDYPIERVELPWAHKETMAGLLELVPDAQQRPCPTILFCNGMDSIKELWPDPIHNWFVERGLNVLCIDGPGLGVSNLRKIHVNADNWERAGRLAIDYLRTRPEVDSNRIGVCGMSMGAYWAVRTAAFDGRVQALATASALHGPKLAFSRRLRRATNRSSCRWRASQTRPSSIGSRHV